MMQTLELDRPCPICKREYKLVLEGDEIAAYERWMDGELIQNAFPNWNSEKREILKTGVCKKCWNDLFDYHLTRK